MNIFFISHFIQLWLLPPGINLLIGLIGILSWRHWPVLAKTLVTIAFVSLWLLSTPIIASYLIDPLQNKYPALALNQLPQSANTSAIVILGGGEGESPEYENHRSVSDATLSRLHYAAYLYRITHMPVIVSGGRPENSAEPEAHTMQNVLVNDFQIPVQWEETKSINTADESKLLIPILTQNKITTIYLVTNAWHMTRSMYAFQKAFKGTGLNVIAAPTGYTSLETVHPLLKYIPSSDALAASAIALHEYIGLLWYTFYM